MTIKQIRSNQEIYNDTFNKGRKWGITKTINEDLMYRVSKYGWELDEKQKKFIVSNVTSKFWNAIDEAKLNADEYKQLINYLFDRVGQLLKEMKTKSASNNQENYYLSLLERVGEIGNKQANQFDVAMEIDRLNKRVRYSEMAYFVNDEQAQAVRMKHYDKIMIKEKLYPTYYMLLNEADRELCEGALKIHINRYKDKNLIGKYYEDIGFAFFKSSLIVIEHEYEFVPDGELRTDLLKDCLRMAKFIELFPKFSGSDIFHLTDEHIKKLEEISFLTEGYLYK